MIPHVPASAWRRPAKSRPAQPSHGRYAFALDAELRQALDAGRSRLLIAATLFALAFVVVGWRLVGITVFAEPAATRHAAAIDSQAATGRADILDRNGVVLATSLPTASLYANPRQISDPAAVARRLSEVLPGLPLGEVVADLASDRSFVWVKRNLTPREHYEVNGLGIPGLYFRREAVRSYPQGRLAAHVLGYTDVDGRGQAGIEAFFDERLSRSGRPLRLSIDSRVQHLLGEEIAAAMQTFRAIGAAGIVLDVESGEVLAMASLPDFDPEVRGDPGEDARFNRAAQGVYELGSVFKIFTTALALDSRTVTLRDGYDTSKPLRAARFTIRDYKPKNRWLSVPEIFIYSSNIGTARMAMDTGTAAQRAFLSDLGLTYPAPLELPEIAPPMLPRSWGEISTMTISYGHGLSVSPVQLAGAVAAIVNGGRFNAPTLLAPEPGGQSSARQVIESRTSRIMRRLMRLVVRHGTGRKADAEGYLVGGKTGTADKVSKWGGYRKKANIASFVGAFPMDAPRYLVFVMLDEPKGTKQTHNYATGGWVAAPTVRRVVQRMAPLLGIEPVEEAAEDEAGERLLKRAAVKVEHLASR